MKSKIGIYSKTGYWPHFTTGLQGDRFGGDIAHSTQTDRRVKAAVQSRGVADMFPEFFRTAVDGVEWD